MTILFQPAELLVVGNVAPKEITANRVPGWTFGPERSPVQPLDRSVADLILVESLVQPNHIRIGVACWVSLCAKVTRKSRWRHPGQARHGRSHAQEFSTMHFRLFGILRPLCLPSHWRRGTIDELVELCPFHAKFLL